LDRRLLVVWGKVNLIHLVAFCQFDGRCLDAHLGRITPDSD
jgi:hypothetical protein